MPRSYAQTRQFGLGLSEVRTCKVPPTHRYAGCRGSAPSPITLTAKRSLLPVGEPLSPFEVELFVARFLGTPSACTSARSHLLPGQELPSAAKVVRPCSLYPLDGICTRFTCCGLAPLALLTESLGRRGLPLSPTFARASDRTSGLVSASLLRVRPMSLRRTGRVPLNTPSSTSREFHHTSSDDAWWAGGDPATLRRLVRPIFRGLSVSEGPIERLGNNAPETEPGPSRHGVIKPRF